MLETNAIDGQTIERTTRAAISPEPFEGRPPLRSIEEIQGTGLKSPIPQGERVAARGVVTQVGRRGFTIQTPDRPGHAASLGKASRGLIVFTNETPGVEQGSVVEVWGKVREVEGSWSDPILSNTEIKADWVQTLTAAGEAGRLPRPVEIGGATGIRPSDSDGAAARDTFEKIEGMRVSIAQAIVVGPMSGSTFTVMPKTPDRAYTRHVTAAGELIGGPGARHTGRVHVKVGRDLMAGGDGSFVRPNMGDVVSNIAGVFSTQYGKYVLQPDHLPGVQPSGAKKDVTRFESGKDNLVIMTFNLKNIDPKVEDPELTQDNRRGDDDVGAGRFRGIAEQIHENAKSPPIIGLQEVQDDSGTEQDGTVSATKTLMLLRDELFAVSGKRYEFVEIAPVDGEEGGQPGGNIRVAYLYDPERVQLVDGSVQRAFESDDSFEHTRKSLAATFRYEGRTVTLLNNHLTAKMGSDDDLGEHQPPRNGNEAQRTEQLGDIAQWMTSTSQQDPDAWVVGTGDMNEGPMYPPIQQFDGLEPVLLTGDIAPTHVHNGLGIPIDHMFMIAPAGDDNRTTTETETLRINAHWADQKTDHNPVLLDIRFPKRAQPAASGQN